MEYFSIVGSWIPNLAGIPAVLGDLRLWMVLIFSAVVALLGSVSVASRPAAVSTGQVQVALSVSQIFLILQRLANLFYLPLMASVVDKALKAGHSDHVDEQILAVILASSVGGFLSFVLLGNFVSFYRFAVEQMVEFGSSLRFFRSLLHPRRWPELVAVFRRSTPLNVKLFQLQGVPADFLIMNVVATAIWTSGALSAVAVSAHYPEYQSTAVLLSGLVNAFAAIAFSVFVDPKAAVITDQVIKKERPDHHVNVASYHIAFGNFVGALLGVLTFGPACSLIATAAQKLGGHGQGFVDGIWYVVAINTVVMLLASTTYASRVSAVTTKRAATALAIYNLFFLVTRLAGQVYAPILGSVCDHLVRQGPGQIQQLEMLFRKIIFGGTLGVLGGFLLLPTFIEVYNKAVAQLDRHGDLSKVLLMCLLPTKWPKIISCLRPPSLLGVRVSDFQTLPKSFLIGNVLVLSVHSVGVMAAIYAGAELGEGFSRTATYLSSVVNGLATITLGMVVDPTTALIADNCLSSKRPEKDIKTTAVGLLFGMLLGTLIAQVVFMPAVWVIELAAKIMAH